MELTTGIYLLTHRPSKRVRWTFEKRRRIHRGGGSIHAPLGSQALPFRRRLQSYQTRQGSNQSGQSGGAIRDVTTGLHPLSRSSAFA